MNYEQIKRSDDPMLAIYTEMRTVSDMLFAEIRKLNRRMERIERVAGIVIPADDVRSNPPKRERSRVMLEREEREATIPMESRTTSKVLLVKGGK